MRRGRVGLNELGLLRERRAFAVVFEPGVLVFATVVMRRAFLAGPTLGQRIAPLSMIAFAIALAAQRFHQFEGLSLIPISDPPRPY